jgi:hypothetical protein
MEFGHYNITPLIFLIVTLYLGLNWIFNFIESKGFKKFQAPSIFGIISIILFLINNYCWNSFVINPLLIDCPDISGKYIGTVNIRHLNDSTKKEAPTVYVNVIQTGTTLNFDLYSKKGSHSTNIVTKLIKINNLWYVYTIYKNENIKNPDNRNKYEGVSKFEVHETVNSIDLIGQFYTDESRKTYGTIHLKKQNNE